MALRLVEVTGRWRGYGDAAAMGSVVFTPEGFRDIAADDTTLGPVPVPLELDPDGAISTQLFAPVDPDEPDVRYQVAIRLVGRPTVVSDDFEILMPVVPPDGAVTMALSDRDKQTGLMVATVPEDPDPGDGGDGGGTGVFDCADCLSG